MKSHKINQYQYESTITTIAVRIEIFSLNQIFQYVQLIFVNLYIHSPKCARILWNANNNSMRHLRKRWMCEVMRKVGSNYIIFEKLDVLRSDYFIWNFTPFKFLLWRKVNVTQIEINFFLHLVCRRLLSNSYNNKIFMFNITQIFFFSILISIWFYFLFIRLQCYRLYKIYKSNNYNEVIPIRHRF